MSEVAAGTRDKLVTVQLIKLECDLFGSWGQRLAAADSDV